MLQSLQVNIVISYNNYVTNYNIYIIGMIRGKKEERKLTILIHELSKISQLRFAPSLCPPPPSPHPSC